MPSIYASKSCRIEHEMVLAGKLFLVEDEIDLQAIAVKLKGFKSEEILKDDDIKLITEIQDLRLTINFLSGTFIQDRLLEVYHRGERVRVPTTSEAPFFFVQRGEGEEEGEGKGEGEGQSGKIVLTIMDRKARANNIANLLSKILFIRTGKIVEVQIEPARFTRFHEDNFADTKIIFFDDLGISNTNIKKLSLYGSELGNTSAYADHIKRGKIWYIVLKSKRSGLVVGVTRNGVVTIFSKAAKDEFIEYVKEEIVDLVV
ncbi:MAG: hypothetical protein H0M93_01400 [Methanophagales archaeon]|nr:hypothetical protein [Methanophagales archaeon]